MPAAIKIRIPWEADWNQACAWAIEHYGLPGDKFTTRPGQDYIDFYFTNERDAIVFELTWG